MRGGGRSELYVLSLAADGTAAGKPRRITDAEQRPSIIDADWAPDGNKIVFSEGDYLYGTAWVTPASGGKRVPLPEAGDRVGRLSVSRSASRFAFQRVSFDQHVWRMPGPHSSNRGGPAERFTPSTEWEMEPQYSPDGKHVAFTSTRSGSAELWVSDSEGRNASQLTEFGGPVEGSPRWSPDSRFLVFDGGPGVSSDLYIVSVLGGKPRRFTTEDSQETRPSWSRDGRRIYFGSNRTGVFQIWKAPVGGGPAVQVTRSGGEEAFESLDGKYLYWAKERKGAIWHMPVGGGAETRVTDAGGISGFAVAPPGIWFIDASSPSAAKLKVLDEATLRVSTFSEFPKETRIDPLSTALSVSPDGRSILYTRLEAFGSNLMLINGFH